MSRYTIQWTHLHILPRSLDYSTAGHRTTYDEPWRLKMGPTIQTSIFACRVEVIVTQKHLYKPRDYPTFSRVSDGGCWTSPESLRDYDS
jgi:hypothetical protein